MGSGRALHSQCLAWHQEWRRDPFHRLVIFTTGDASNQSRDGGPPVSSARRVVEGGSGYSLRGGSLRYYVAKLGERGMHRPHLF